MKRLTLEQKRRYEEEGYLIVEGFFPQELIQALCAELDRLSDGARGLEGDAGGFNLQRPAGGGIQEGAPLAPGLLRKIQEIDRHSERFAALVEHPDLLDAVEDLIGPTLHYHSSKVMFKPARHGSAKPWHQDWAYWQGTRPEQVTCWLALDEATEENGCMQLVPGSHRGGFVPHVDPRELQIEAARVPGDRVRVAPMKPGSMLFFHVLTWHYSAPNRSDKSRRSFIVDYDPNGRGAGQGGLAGDRLLRGGAKVPEPGRPAPGVSFAAPSGARP
ncbi:MAG: phytanoyl-CoA dioxygenase family protein [Spirochaetes bacterium]|nr:phytanoyl-CoA dioxygenase family protein [Spirochaetota bacterium]